MRRLIVALFALGCFLQAAPAGAEETWGIGSSGEEPAYSVPIHVVDAVVGTLYEPHRDDWRRARNEALEQWGVPFTVTRMAEGDLAYLYDANIGTVGIDGMLVPDSILLVRNRMDSQLMGGYSSGVNAGIAIYAPWRPWWRRSGADELRGVIAHEVGHALGFFHGGTGVMGGSIRVSDQERAMALAFYCEVA